MKQTKEMNLWTLQVAIRKEIARKTNLLKRIEKMIIHQTRQGMHNV